MELAGVAVAFIAVMYLVSKNVAMGLSLIIGTGIAALFSGLAWLELTLAIVQGLLSPMTIQLIISVALISGLGKAMKASGDLDLIVNSLVTLFRNPKLLIAVLPALIGTINVPGGAIISAPMVEENGQSLALKPALKSAINLFFRHVAYFVYPLHSSLVIITELLGVRKGDVIRYNAIAMLVGIFIAYPLFFRGVEDKEIPKKDGQSTIHSIKRCLLGFSPILATMGLVLIFNVPFYIAIAAGVTLALTRGLMGENHGTEFIHRLRQLFVEWIDYKLVLVIAGVMMFKSVIEASGVLGTLVESLFAYGIPLPLLVLVLGFLTSYIIGAHMAASGILVALFASIIPQASLAPYASLLYLSIMLGYLLSPIHLCLVLTNQYFGAKYLPVTKKLILPVLAMLAVAMVQLLFTLL